MAAGSCRIVAHKGFKFEILIPGPSTDYRISKIFDATGKAVDFSELECYGLEGYFIMRGKRFEPADIHAKALKEINKNKIKIKNLTHNKH